MGAGSIRARSDEQVGDVGEAVVADLGPGALQRPWIVRLPGRCTFASRPLAPSARAQVAMLAEVWTRISSTARIGSGAPMVHAAGLGPVRGTGGRCSDERRRSRCGEAYKLDAMDLIALLFSLRRGTYHIDSHHESGRSVKFSIVAPVQLRRRRGHSRRLRQ
jgi:hypothetical protein